MSASPDVSASRSTGRRRRGGPGPRSSGEPRPGASDLEVALGRALDGEVRFDDHTRHLFSTDASMYAITPIGVAFPRHADDVQAAVEVAARFGVPVLPRGAGTSHCGQTVGEAVVLDLSRHLSQITELDPESRTARVQPGVIQDQLNRAAAPHGLLFGPDTSTSNRATLGGMIGNNSCGARSAQHGMTIDHVTALDVVLSDASTARFTVRDAAEVAARAARDTLEGRLYREIPGLVEAHRDAIVEHTQPFWRRSGGYRLERLLPGFEYSLHPGAGDTRRTAPPGGLDLTPLIVGSEGTLVTVTEATVGLVDLPSTVGLAVGHFSSLQAAIDAAASATELGAATIEMVDRPILNLSRQSPEHRDLVSILDGDPAALLFVEFHGEGPTEVRSHVDRLARRWQERDGAYAVLRPDDASSLNRIRALRRAGLGLLMASAKGSERSLAFIEDTAVDPLRLGPFAERLRGILDGAGLTAGFYGHASSGCLHIRPFMDLLAPGQVDLMHRVAEQVAELVDEFGGVNSSEHGDGIARSEFNERLFGAELYGAMRRVKALFDPDGRMNPGKVVDAPAMTEHLREPALPTPIHVDTTFDFGGPTGWHAAANRCMRIGACRKLPESGGTMCPSYMATRDEEHSTRGRANALVKALSAPATPAAAVGSAAAAGAHTATDAVPSGAPHAFAGLGLTDERLHEILDLCLECKACAAECPLSVDMATMKSEFLHHYQREHGTTLRTRLFGAVRRLNRLGSVFAPVSNLPLRLPLVRVLMERVVGIDRRRPLPRFQRETLPRWFGRRRAGAHPAPQGTVVLVADSFTSFTEPGIGRAAVELLEAAGYAVRLESEGCCGRAAISKGLLDDARDRAADLVARLAPYAAQGIPIVGVEPSCILTLREEYPRLLAGPEVEQVAAHARMVDDLLVEAIDDGRLVLASSSDVANRHVLFHGHCHQKAITGLRSTTELLKRLPGARVEVLDAGCCGMAGSFGFEAEHYDLAMSIGEQRLFPAVRATGHDTLIAATGVSCRQQISHGTERRAQHPIELIRAAVAVPDTDRR